jgi:hypothetical protein
LRKEIKQLKLAGEAQIEARKKQVATNAEIKAESK